MWLRLGSISPGACILGVLDEDSDVSEKMEVACKDGSKAKAAKKRKRKDGKLARRQAAFSVKTSTKEEDLSADSSADSTAVIDSDLPPVKMVSKSSRRRTRTQTQTTVGYVPVRWSGVVYAPYDSVPIDYDFDGFTTVSHKKERRWTASRERSDD
ncbi:hypothetical protein EW145_g7218 [Phellinidium pouzarii]|uniref:Uncharacterized protein n=1 Tax=Phellinidium pouzarii TaxID=167371 RepID=A0A4S4KN16_9AGAM|nr:hypothetical protein EW145_g7218 [Phellinidium pouzarii]